MWELSAFSTLACCRDKHIVGAEILQTHISSFLEVQYRHVSAAHSGYFSIPNIKIYCQLSLSRIPRDSLNYFEISVLRHIRFAELRKNKSNNHILQMYMYFYSWNWKYIENAVEKRRNCFLGAISPLFHNVMLPVVRFSCLNRDQIFTLRKAVIQEKRGRDNESRLYM